VGWSANGKALKGENAEESLAQRYQVPSFVGQKTKKRSYPPGRFTPLQCTDRGWESAIRMREKSVDDDVALQTRDSASLRIRTDRLPPADVRAIPL
jgi:hypothetical protein